MKNRTQDVIRLAVSAGGLFFLTAAPFAGAEEVELKPEEALPQQTEIQKSAVDAVHAADQAAAVKSTGAEGGGQQKDAVGSGSEVLSGGVTQPAGAVDATTIDAEEATDRFFHRNSADSSSHVNANTVRTVESTDGSRVTTVSEGTDETTSDLDFLKDRLQIGLRSVVSRSLDEDDSGHKGGTYGSGTYLGTIYGLDLQQNAAPVRPFITAWFVRYVGIEVAYDFWEADTLAMDIPYSYKEKSDGSLTLKGPTLSLLLRYPNASGFTPWGGFGVGFFSADFDATAAWASSWGGSRKRVMDCDSVTATILTGGLTWEFIDHWNVDLSAQYISNADVDAVFRGYTNGVEDTTQPGHFPMDNWAFRLGLSYSF